MQISFNAGILNSTIAAKKNPIMYVLTVCTVFAVALAAMAWQVFSWIRVPSAVAPAVPPGLSADRYRPMLRLLDDEDLEFVPANGNLRRNLRTLRRKLFRRYLRCLARDYALLLGGVRAVMAQSGVDRPDLARALAKNRMLFAFSLYKIELRLAAHAVGFGKVDISGLVEALEALRQQVSVLTAAPSAA